MAYFSWEMEGEHMSFSSNFEMHSAATSLLFLSSSLFYSERETRAEYEIFGAKFL